MKVLENISLKPFNTFGIDVVAKHYVSVKSIDDLKDALSLKDHPEKFILSGGSNMLLTRDIESLVIHLNLKGISIVKKEDDFVEVEVQAGENWHEFVMWCLDKDLGGVENLSLIPGNVGTAPIQNIGAYGVELKDVFVSCNAIHIKDLISRTFTLEECQFGYRDSIFKSNEKGNYVITSVILRLTKTDHTLNTAYGAISEQLAAKNISTPTIRDISEAVITIRSSKLPDPKEIGNSGSFFKNPVISKIEFEQLRVNFPEIPGYIVTDEEIKVPAGWLIEKAGFKGKKFGNYGVHDKQALVLVNFSDASGSEIYNLSPLTQSTIKRILNINLQAEVNII